MAPQNQSEKIYRLGHPSCILTIVGSLQVGCKIVFLNEQFTFISNQIRFLVIRESIEFYYYPRLRNCVGGFPFSNTYIPS